MKREECSALVCVLENRVKEIDTAIDLASDMVADREYAGCKANEEIQITKILTLKSDREKLIKTLDWLKSDRGGKCIICDNTMQFEDLVNDHRTRICQECCTIMT